MISKGYLLIHSDGIPYEPWETILAFSEDKEELEKKASLYNKEAENILERFKNVTDDMDKYDEKFYTFRGLFEHEPTKLDFQNWIIQNPIPKELQEFLEIEEYEEDGKYMVSLRETFEHELWDHYYVKTFGKK